MQESTETNRVFFYRECPSLIFLFLLFVFLFFLFLFAERDFEGQGNQENYLPAK